MSAAPAVKKTFFTDDLLQDPYPIYQRFLEEGPIHYLDRGGPGPGIWGIFSYTDSATTLKDQRLSAKRSQAFLASLPPEQQVTFAPLAQMLGYWMLFLDPPEHSRLRKLMNKGFSPAAAEALRAPIEAIVAEMLASLHNASESDLMHEVAHPLPVRAIARMLGVPDTMQPQLVAWSDTIAAFLGTPRRPIELVSAAQEAVVALTNFFREMVAQRRLAKGDDLISLLLDIEEDGDVLTEDELYAQCVMLLFGGHETTRNLIGNGLLTLLRHPEQAARLRDDPSIIRSAVEELLRYESPVQTMSRITKEEVEICGQRISPGSVIYCILGSANRDPQHFKNAHSLELERLNNSHLAFGAGAHFCIGNQIARLEAQTAILALVRTFPDMRLTEDRPHWSQNFTLRGLEKLEVSLPRAKSL